MNLPNKLTMARIIAVPIFIIFYMVEWFVPALIVFILASITDMLDGKIARKYNLITNFGKIMDPLADKILVYSAFILFVADHTMPAWMMVVILAREFMVSGIRTVAASQGIVIAAAMSGKIKTVLQMFTVILFLLFYAIFSNLLFTFMSLPVKIFWIICEIVLWASLVMTAYSGIEYVVKNRKVFAEKED